jgi:hypothetical protein
MALAVIPLFFCGYFPICVNGIKNKAFFLFRLAKFYA